ncbi:hypothetical protein [Robertkochia solimangrovi]|uniref:hypothetical protein n=1 Tax=Robertkochia solimangrovi TaxID=2213046 RepID=UPI00117C1D2F|nr:hypothetical protein [Robertkochia solimangrovi]TRZ42025.1 hypothetical protein DMZ48_15435 [Robertkochia solimangrovi]
MKRIALLLVCNLLVLSAFAQSEQWSVTGNSTLLNLKNKNLENVEGSPYLKEGNFTKGTIIKNGKEINNMDLRYNAFHDRVEVLVKEDEVYETTKSDNIEFMIDGQLVKAIPYLVRGKVNTGFLFCLSCEDGIDLYKRYYKEYLEPETGATGYHKDKPARFIEHEELYIKTPEMEYPQALEHSKRKIARQLGGNEDQLTAFIKSEDLDLKEDIDNIKLVNYYRTIQID